MLLINEFERVRVNYYINSINLSVASRLTFYAETVSLIFDSVAVSGHDLEQHRLLLIFVTFIRNLRINSPNSDCGRLQVFVIKNLKLEKIVVRSLMRPTDVRVFPWQNFRLNAFEFANLN